jgi:hypothetical protein
MNKEWSFTKKDMEFLDDVGVMEIDLAARKWSERMGWDPLKAEHNARSWLQRIRVRYQRCQDYVNKTLAKQKRNARIRKFTTSGALPEHEEEKVIV